MATILNFPRPCDKCKERALDLLFNTTGIFIDVLGILSITNDLATGKTTRRQAMPALLLILALLVATAIMVGRRQGIHLLADKLNAARMAEYREEEKDEEEEPETAPVHTDAVEPITETKNKGESNHD